MSGVVEFERGVVAVEAMRWGSGLGLSLSFFFFACAFMLTVSGVVHFMWRGQVRASDCFSGQAILYLLQGCAHDWACSVAG